MKGRKGVVLGFGVNYFFHEELKLDDKNEKKETLTSGTPWPQVWADKTS